MFYLFIYLIIYLFHTKKNQSRHLEIKIQSRHKFTGKENSRASPVSPATLLKRFWLSCFPVNFANFLRITFLENTSRQLLLSPVIKRVSVRRRYHVSYFEFSAEEMFFNESISALQPFYIFRMLCCAFWVCVLFIYLLFKSLDSNIMLRDLLQNLHVPPSRFSKKTYSLK